MLSNERIRELWENYSPTQGIESFARAVEAEVRKEDEALIRQLMLALDDCAEDSETVVNDYVQAYGESFRPNRLKGLRDIVAKAKEALDAARLRLLDSDLSHLTERGKEAWAGVDPQKLRESGGL